MPERRTIIPHRPITPALRRSLFSTGSRIFSAERCGSRHSVGSRLFQHNRPASDVATDPARCPRRVTTGLLPQFGYRRFSTIRVRSRTRPTCSRPQSLARQGFRNSVLNGAVQSFGDVGANRERFAAERAVPVQSFGRNPLVFLGFSALHAAAEKVALGRVGGGRRIRSLRLSA